MVRPYRIDYETGERIPLRLPIPAPVPPVPTPAPEFSFNRFLETEALFTGAAREEAALLAGLLRRYRLTICSHLQRWRLRQFMDDHPELFELMTEESRAMGALSIMEIWAEYERREIDRERRRWRVR